MPGASRRPSAFSRVARMVAWGRRPRERACPDARRCQAGFPCERGWAGVLWIGLAVVVLTAMMNFFQVVLFFRLFFRGHGPATCRGRAASMPQRPDVGANAKRPAHLPCLPEQLRVRKLTAGRGDTARGCAPRCARFRVVSGLRAIEAGWDNCGHASRLAEACPKDPIPGRVAPALLFPAPVLSFVGTADAGCTT